MVGSLASRGSQLTCVTPLMLHKMLPQALNGCLVPLAPPAPLALLPLPALRCQLTPMMLLTRLLLLPGLGCPWMRRGVW